jgi:hypothetical protein
MNVPAQVRRIFRASGFCLLALVAGALAVWSFGAIHFDGPFPGWGNTVLGAFWLAGLWWSFSHLRHPARRVAVCCAWWLAVLIPWLLKKPSHERDWPPEFERTATAAINGDVVTITNFRAFDYLPDGTPVPRWTTRMVRLSELRGMDFFMTYWGNGKLMGHPVFSFDFGPDGHVAFSIESRREEGENYSLIGGLYKRDEMIYLAGEESDIIRLRTNFREDEHVYLYRLQVRQATAMLRFMEYLDAMNHIAERPRFYDTLTGNCTTAIRAQIRTRERHSFDWRIIANGRLDTLFHERGLLSDELPFAELKKRAYINPAARRHPQADGFSATIRENMPGFGKPAPR